MHTTVWVCSTQIVYYLSGLTCTDENFIQKAGAQRKAAELGLALVAPDTSPRGLGIPGEDESWDFGVGAGEWAAAASAFTPVLAGPWPDGRGGWRLPLRHSLHTTCAQVAELASP